MLDRARSARRVALIFGVCLLMTNPPARAGDGAGSLDPSWGGDGIVITRFGLNAGANGVAIQDDGKVVVVGRALDPSRFVLARYGRGGRLDDTIGGDGRVETDIVSGRESANDVVIQANGKIVVAGEVARTPDSFALVRYLPRGRLDSRLGGDGIVFTRFSPRGPDSARALILQPDGKIVVAGSACGGGECRFALARYRRDGTLDQSFGGDGRVTTRFTGGSGAWDVALQEDGRIVVVGGANHLLAIARYEPSGSLDDSFSGDGRVTLSVDADEQTANGVAIQADGKIVIVGGGSSADPFAWVGFIVVRLDTTGTPDALFGGGDGIVLTPFEGFAGIATDVAIQDDGKIVAIGYAGPDPGYFSLARYEIDGSPDLSFDGDGMASPCVCGFYPAPTAVATQANGRIVVVGHTDTFNIDSQFGILRVLD